MRSGSFGFAVSAVLSAAPLASGCTGHEEYAPTVSFLAPAADSTVAAGEVAVSIVVDDFELVAREAQAPSSPSHVPLALALVPVASAHNDGVPAGYCELSLDDVTVAELSEPQGTVTVEAGAHTLSCRLLYADGDPLDPPANAVVSFTATDGP